MCAHWRNTSLPYLQIGKRLCRARSVQPPTELNSLDCGVEKVRTLLASLDGPKPAGPDGFHPLILKYFTAIISSAVVDLFNRSMSDGALPSEWKCSVVKPIPKGGDPRNVDNYRPSSLTSVLAKELENVVKKGLLQLLASKDLLKLAQHGFMKGRSCITNLLLTRPECLQALNREKPVDVIYIDSSKACDKVRHVVLLHKLRARDVCGSLHQWISDFLIGRIWWVQVNDHLTDCESSTSGVRKGTILGSVSFLIHINKLPQLLRSPGTLFEDDLKICRVIDSPDDCDVIQQDLNRLSQ
ncbi:unnamed protein product [Dicrocoelium dendriticum]|nr:unnamed protein product [Dicrocoelium dendriticum]